MKRSQLREIIRNTIKKELAENQPKPEQPNTPAPTITPEKGTEKEEEEKRRKIGKPGVKPGKKASIEEEMLDKIVARYKSKSPKMNEDLDLGHEDDEPHMLRADLYRIAKYAIELYKMLEPFDKMEGEVDLPQWWQEKIIKSKSMLVAAKHYLDFEMKEPSIDASLNGAAMNEATPAKPSAKPTQFKQDIAAAKKMIEAGKSEKEVVSKYGQAVFNAVNAQNMDEGKKIDSKDYVLARKAAIEKSKLKK